MSQKFYIKVFKIKDTHFELRSKSFEEVVSTIVENHKRHIYATESNPNIFNTEFEASESGQFKFASYCYNQPIERHYWKSFLPSYIGQDQNFSIVKFSYVLFIYFDNSTYCVIGGAGIGVIKSYINLSFGIDVYSRIAKPSEDLIIEIKSRSIANNVSLQTTTFNFNQTVADTIEFSEIPAVMKIIIREELKNDIFKQYNLDRNQAILEVGSYFCLRKVISFDELLKLMMQLNSLIKNSTPVDLSFFRKIEEEGLTDILEENLIDSIIHDIQNFSFQSIEEIDRRDIDIVHPTKLEKFYECDKYIVRFKNSRSSTDKVVYNRQMIYLSTIEHIYSRLEGDFEAFNIKNEIYKNQIKGIRNDEELTHGTFLNHIVAEISVDHKRYFKIDKEWYHLQDLFIQKLTDSAIENYQRYKLHEPILKYWPGSINEDGYNRLHDFANSYSMDRLLIDNIELCDILHIADNRAYFIHVKDGFDVKLRDCYIQVVLSAKRLKMDLNDSNGNNYLIPTLNSYNSRSQANIINIDDFVNKLSDKTMQVVFVLAFRSKNINGGIDLERIRHSNSNIAKYSIVNVVKEMNGLFELKIFDIGNVTDD